MTTYEVEYTVLVKEPGALVVDALDLEDAETKTKEHVTDIYFDEVYEVTIESTKEVVH